MRKKYIFEAAGVPKFIFESSVEIYEEILNTVKRQPQIVEEDTYWLDIDFNIGDLSFHRVIFTLTFVEYDGDEMQWIKMGISNKSELMQNYFFKHVNEPGEIDLILHVAVPQGWEYDEFIKFFIDHRKKMIESISHELMHVYENTKKGIQDTRDLAEYVAYGKVKTGIKPVDTFGHYLYYVTMIENIVRPTEVNTYLKLNQATRKKFLDLLKDNDTYKKLIDIKNFSYDKMREDLMGKITEIDNFFEEVGLESHEYEDLNDEEKIDKLLDIYYNSLSHSKADSLFQMLSTNFLEAVSGFVGDKDKFFKKFLNKISRFKSFEEFFRYEESNFKNVATTMIKKISKVYSLLDEEKNNHIQESIINWDLYHRINKTQEKFLNELKNRIVNPKKSMYVR